MSPEDRPAKRIQIFTTEPLPDNFPEMLTSLNPGEPIVLELTEPIPEEDHMNVTQFFVEAVGLPLKVVFSFEDGKHSLEIVRPSQEQ